jgi:sugar lactone lactonase YvrE
MDAARCVLDEVGFAEGMRWHADALWFSDITRDRVMRFDPVRGELETVARIPSPSGLGFGVDGRVYVVSLGHDLLYGFGPGEHPEIVLDLAAVSGTMTFNDAISDARGRLYLGSVGIPAETRASSGELPGDLWLVDTAELVTPRAGRLRITGGPGRLTRVASDLAAPNGMAIRPDGGSLVVAEIRGGRVTVFDIAPDGTLRNRRALTEARTSDGITGDRDGGVWMSGLPRGDGTEACGFERVAVDGERTDRVHLDLPFGWQAITSLLGDADRRTLYMAVARFDSSQWFSSPDAWEHKQSEGQIWAARVEVPGAGWP